jgi:transposase
VDSLRLVICGRLDCRRQCFLCRVCDRGQWYCSRACAAYLRLDTLPGEQAQVDWGNFGPIRVGSTTRLLSCFALVLSWSRACDARFALDQTRESFLRGHVEAFAALQGVPRTLLYDNVKSVVLERVGEHIRFHPRVLELAGHYHFAPQPCAVARGNEKGRVERFLGFLRHSFFAARPFRSVEDLNAQLARWIAEVAHARLVPIPPSLIRRPLTLVASEHHVRLRGNGNPNAAPSSH